MIATATSSRFRQSLWLALVAVAGLIGAARAEEPAAPDLTTFWRTFFARPAGIPSPPDNPLTPDKVELGRALFSDPRLSGPGTRACASCHDPARSFTDGRTRAAALDGVPLARNVPALWNLAWGRSFLWDGRAESLEVQARFPIEHPRELAGDWPTIERRLGDDPAMARAFATAFPEAPTVTAATISKALAAYERTLVSPPTRFDRWVAGDEAALGPRERDGFRLFVGKAGCVGCHAGWRFTDDRFHDIGLKSDDPGRGAVPGGIPGLRAFKTPGLREVRWTAPYMHDGSLATLDAVLDHYGGRLEERPSLSANIVRGLRLSAEERASLVAFLETLSSEQPPATAPGPALETSAKR